MTRKTDPVDQRKIDTFFAELAKTDHVGKAAEVSGLPPRTVYGWRDKDPEFAQRWQEARESFADHLEAEATRRAVAGVEKGVWHQGVRVGNEQQYSDSLLALMLKAKRAREYGDKSKVELTGADGGPIKTEETPTAIGRKIAFALAVAMRDKDKAAGEAPDAPAVDPDSGEDMA
jgi:hypothetical protein